MKRLAYSSTIFGLLAILVGIGMLVHDYLDKTPVYDPYGYAGEVNYRGYASIIRFLTCIFGGIVALAVGAYLRSLQKPKRP